MKRFFSIVMTFILIMQFYTVFYAADTKSVDLGTPQNPEIIASDVEESDKFNSFLIKFTNESSTFNVAKGYTLKLDWRMRLDGVNDWYEVNEFVDIEKAENSSVGLFYIRPGNVEAFKTAQPELYKMLSPALTDFKLWSGEKGLCFDRDNFSLEIQLRYRAEKEKSESIVGKWSESAFFGRTTINEETPSSLVGKPELTSVEYKFASDSDCNIKFVADIPQSIMRYKNSTVGELKLAAQVDFGNQAYWYEFFSEKLSKTDLENPISADINLQEAAKLNQFSDTDFPDATSKITTPIAVRIRCEWYSHNDEKSKEDNTIPQLITEWTEMSVEVNGSAGIATQAEKPDDEGGLSFVIILAICCAVVVVAVCTLILIKKRKAGTKNK